MPRPAEALSRSALSDLKRQNEWLVLDALRDGGAPSRAELAQTTGLSRSTIGNVVRALHDRGLVAEGAHAGVSHPLTGRPAFGVGLRPSAGVAVGVAINRARMRVAAADLTGRVLAEHHASVDRSIDAPTILKIAAAHVRGVVADAELPVERIAGVGLGIPGPVDLDLGGVDPRSSLRRWAGVPARRLLSHHLNGTPVVADNDANYGALGELHYGVAKGVENLIYVTVGPGIGAGIVLGGALQRGHGYAGEIGHSVAVPDGVPCSCGRRGCLSTVGTSVAILDAFERRYGHRPPIAELIELAAGGDEATHTLFRDAGAHLGRVCSVLVDALNPELLVLGGELGSPSPSLLAGARDALDGRVQPLAAEVRTVHGTLGDRSEVLGAVARVVKDDALVSAFVLGG